MAATIGTQGDSAPDSPYRFWKDPAVWLLLLAAFFFRLLYNLALHPDSHPASTFVIDEREYFGASHMFAEGRGFSFYDDFLWVRPPLYVIYLGSIFRLLGSTYSYLPVLITQSALSAVSLLPLGRLAASAGGRVAALSALILGLIYLPFTLFAGLLLSETLFICLFAFSLLVLVNARSSIQCGWGRAAVAQLLAAGALLGLATLTRATALAFLPVAGVWLLWGRDRHGLRRRVGAALLVTGSCIAMLVPWTVRNYGAYHRFVLVDTTGGYNLWLASIGVRDEGRLRADLLTIPNQADRQSFAYSQAIRTITADPAAFVGKGLKESLDLWKPLLSAEENSARGYPSGRVPPWHLASLLVLDTGIYALILLLAVVGFALSPPSASKWLTGGWVLLWVAMSFVFFAVTRFRSPVVASLLPWAGVGVSLLRQKSWRPATPGVKLATGLALAAIIVLVLGNAPVQDTALGVAAWNRQEPYREGEQLLSNGRPQEAASMYKRADMNIADTRYGLASTLLMEGANSDALQQLRADEPADRYEPAILRGQAARLVGDLSSARSFFNARVVQVHAEDALDWAWSHLAVSTTDKIELGSGLDVGYVRGFYGPEKDASGVVYRWSRGQSEVRGMSEACSSNWSGWRPQGLPPATVAISPPWHPSPPGAYSVTLPAANIWVNQTISGVPSPLQFSTNAFVASGADPRLLGVRVARVGKCKK